MKRIRIREAEMKRIRILDTGSLSRFRGAVAGPGAREGEAGGTTAKVQEED